VLLERGSQELRFALPHQAVVDVDARQAVANRARTASTMPEVERQIVTQENLINFLLGRNPGPIPRGAALTDQYYPPSIPAGLPSALLERRPDVKGAEDLLLASNAEQQEYGARQHSDDRHEGP